MILTLCGLLTATILLAYMVGTSVGEARTVARLRKLGEGWLGYDDSHGYGHRLLTLLQDIEKPGLRYREWPH